MFDDLNINRPLSKQEKALLYWLQSKIHQAHERDDRKESLLLVTEFLALIDEIDSN